MATKLNKAGQQQPYVPAGHGDASGEYRGKETNDNIKDKLNGKPQKKENEPIENIKKKLGGELTDEEKLERLRKLEEARGVNAKKDINEMAKEISKEALKSKQLDIINKYNPMTDEYHTGIRKIEDIKTFDEVVEDEDSFVWGDYSREDAKRDLAKGTITVYSSNPIKQGTFVSTSRVQAEQYAGGYGNKVYKTTIPLTQVAWITGDEGQFAKVN